MKLIYLRKSLQFAMVDDDDFDFLQKFKWYLSPQGYAHRHKTKKMKDGIESAVLLMHRLIVNAPDGSDVDHVNRETLDNRKLNLRVCSRSQNSMNRPKQPGVFSSQFKGVSLDKARNKWQAHIHFNKKHIAIGRFENELDAARAYDQLAKTCFGEFATLNFKDEV